MTIPRRSWTLAVAIALASAPVPARAGAIEEAQALEARGDAEAALAAWRRAAEHAPADPVPATAVGRLELRLGRAAQAAQTLAGVAAAHPEHPRIHYWHAFALRKAGRLADAAEAYRRALARSPDDPDPHFGLGETLKLQGDGPGALEAFRAYVRLESRPAEARWVGRANEEIARLEASNVVTADEPATPSGGPEVSSAASSTLAPPSATPPAAVPTAAADPDALFAAGRHGEAKRAYLAALATSPDHLGLRHRAAVAALADGDYPEAERQAVHVVRLDPDNPTATAIALAARARRPPAARPTLADAVLALREGRHRTAAELAGELWQADPDGPDAATLAHLRATALMAQGRPGEALDAFRLGGHAGGPPAEFWLTLGDAFHATGDAPAARRAWRIALALAPPASSTGRRLRERLNPPLRAGEPP